MGSVPLITFFFLKHAIHVRKHLVYSKRAVSFIWGMNDAPFTNESLFWVDSVQGLEQISLQNSLNWFANHFEWFVQFPARTESSEVVPHSFWVIWEHREHKDLQSIKAKSAKSTVGLQWGSLLVKHCVCCLWTNPQGGYTHSISFK